jgi:hypothetical protein
MTEAEWLTTKLPLYMLGRESPVVWDERKARLFCCACLRRAPTVLEDERSWQFVEAVENDPENANGDLRLELERALERFTEADRERSLEDYPDSWAYPALLGHNEVGGLVYYIARRATWNRAHVPGVGWVFASWSRQSDDAEAEEKARQADLLREMFGNPFRPLKAEPSWLTSDVLALARGIYEEKAFDRMPILADALQDAGCENVNVLDHCRNPNAAHVRGCWVIDMLLGRSG